MLNLVKKGSVDSNFRVKIEKVSNDWVRNFDLEEDNNEEKKNRGIIQNKDIQIESKTI